ncbi:MAG: hypothetical protein GOMPHAMPRED_008096 [Gomphillus americanus]|uniref:Nephrocystin 3-like N-terminal domain-containing protein n=1 Tax=Gomphillus americanus TaxID=1940652 RepID=A0A8H3EYH9_9LECA|nr:MAG: hypothetical protein GOMPHAMPRED_008096 [Gomphillus americanus]
MADALQLAPADETFTVAVSAKLTHADYTVGWICALPCELAAALAVLDERHEVLVNLPGDTNIYNYGRISGHNVVISSLPNGVYGTTEATAVAIRMLNAFRSITIPLMVGIGGGVPSSRNDIRLADLVVSVPTPDCPAVIQYDYGKTVESGTFERKGHLNKPCLQLLTAVANVRADGLSTKTKIPLIIENILSRSLGREYDYPTDKDILYEPDCEHVSELSKCRKCGPRKPITRPSRLVDLDTEYKPKSAALHRPPLMAHYGPIASANQVMKNGRIRDQIAKPLGILCFEMEAAGLMDNFPCLVIRGVSDYCDARKMKTFQNYAAVVAAAYTKHLLSKVPLQDQEQVQAAKDHFDAVGLGHRLMTIRNPHPNTCSWLFQHPVYEDWLDDSHFTRHHGFLWIKGKPGAGKSTLMKFIRKHFDSQSAVSQTSLISFFFNARGSDLEKSTVGMWRSLLSQLLNAMPSLQMSIDWSCLPAARQEWSLESLQRLFVTMVEQLGQQPLLCLIDALDESPEDDIRTMVGVFEEIGRLNSSGASRVRVLWSSRYYPHISIRYGNEIRLDETTGHSQDMKHYIDTELGAEENELLDDIKAQIFIKSRGIFLWIVLVINILRKEYDHGRIIAMQKKLKVLPEKLTDLFREIVLRDMDNLDEFLLCIQWVLYSLRPLDGTEFYTAMASGLDEEVLLARPSKSTSSVVVPRYVTSSSKGLAELNHQFSSQARVQFIHESVREFLMQDGSMQNVWSGFSALSPGSSHEQLKVCCIRFLAHVQSSIRTSLSFNEIVAEWPFATYAMSNMLAHAEEACRLGYPQITLLDKRVFTYWYGIRLQHGLCPTNFYPTTPNGRLLCCLACDDLPTLLSTQLSRTLSSNTREHFTLPLYCAMKHQSVGAIRVLLLPATEIPDLLIDDLCESFRRKPPTGSESFLSWFQRQGKKELGRHLLRCDERICRHGPTEILNLAAAHG